MSDETTSGAPWRVPMPAIWRAWAGFVRRPQLPAERTRFGWRAIGEVGWLLSLYIGFALPLAAALTALAKRTGITTPDFDVLTRKGVLFTLLVGAVALPAFEETVSRGWLDGRRRHLWLVGVLIAALASLAAVRMRIPEHPLLLAAMALGWAAVALIAGIRASRAVQGWFARAFPALFYVQAALFALAHLSNYDLENPLMLLPFVVPQFIGALIFGFARVRFGVWANIALHGLGNALFLTMAIAGV